MMRTFILFLVFAIAAKSQTAPELPPLFKTTKGVEIKNGKIMSRSDAGLKIMHDNGIITLRPTELPADITNRIGLSPSGEPETKSLPAAITITGKTYASAELAGIDPDGIRIVHSEGASKIPFEEMPPQLVQDFGPFDAELAIKYRAQQKEMQAAIHKARIEHIQKENEIAASSQNSPTQAPSTTTTPDTIVSSGDVSPVVLVKLSARSSGGKNRNTTWETNYGSYNREDTSSRSIYCAVSSLANTPQTVRMQCIFIVRPIQGALVGKVVEDKKIQLTPFASAIASAQAEAKSKDDKYVALGMRFQEGEKYIGWSWRAIDGQGRITSVFSSMPHYDRFGWQTPLNSN